MISGCGVNAREQAAADLGRVTVDVTPIRCPEIDPRVREARAVRVRPPPSQVNADGGTGLDDDAVRVWVDAYEAAISRKDAALDVAIATYDRCRDAPAVVASAGGRR